MKSQSSSLKSVRPFLLGFFTALVLYYVLVKPLQEGLIDTTAAIAVFCGLIFAIVEIRRIKSERAHDARDVSAT